MSAPNHKILGLGPLLLIICQIPEWSQYGCPASFCKPFHSASKGVFTVIAHCTSMECTEIQTTTTTTKAESMPGWNSQMTVGDAQTDKVQINRSIFDRKFRGPRRHMGGAPNSTWRVQDLPSPLER